MQTIIMGERLSRCSSGDDAVLTMFHWVSLELMWVIGIAVR